MNALNDFVSNSSGINYYPIVFCNNYDIRVGFFGKLHPFDTNKWSKIADSISKSLNCNVNYIKVKVKTVFIIYFLTILDSLC